MLALINPFADPIGRAKWWGLQIFIWIVGLGALFVLAVMNQDSPPGARTAGESFGLLLIIAGVVYANLCTCLARLRDSGRSGWWHVAFLLPTVGTGLMIYFCGFEKGDSRGFDIDDFEDQLKREYGRSASRSEAPAQAYQPAPVRQSAPASRQGFGQHGGKPAFGRR